LQGPDLKLLLDAADEAGRIAMKYFKNDVKTWDKGDGQGPVTQADLEIDEMLKDDLLAARPDFGWLSEETDDDLERLQHEQVFIVDPIDGTRSYINGHQNFAIAIAIARKGQIETAVVHCPAKTMTYWAERGKGAFLNGVKIQNSQRKTVKSARVLASGAQMKSDLWHGNPPPIERHFRSSLAYRLCLVAEGRFDGMFTLRDTWEWDVAAGDLICQEAGARVSDMHKNTPVYNSTKPALMGMIAAAPVLHKGLLEYLK